MNPGLKQRLMGGAVLVVLAVIFLPMLLPGKSDSTMPMFGSNVPDKPATKFTPIEIPLELPPQPPTSEVSVVDQTQPGDVTSREKPQLAEPAAAVQAPLPTLPATAPSPQVTPPAAAKAPAAPMVAKSTPAPPSPPPTAHPAAEAWAVQLGSFSSSANAIALQDKARKAGFRAYVEKVKSGSGTSYRVRIGPESSRERADATRGKVESKLKMKALVVPHKS